MILYINSCVRNNSRTDKVTRVLLKEISKGNTITELKLAEENLIPLSDERLTKRTELISQGNYDDPIFDYAKQFANANIIVISAPFWDLSFPSILKTYIENIYVTGIVSEYGQDGMPKGLCKATKLYYVTTAGGPYEEKYSFGYIKSLCTDFFGIKEVKLIKAEMLDVEGFDSDKIVNNTIKNIESGNY